MEAAGLPDDEETLSLLIPLLQTSIEKKAPLTVEDAIDIVKEKREAARTRYATSLSDDEILADEARAERLQKLILERTKEKLRVSQGTTSGKTGTQGPTEERRAEAKKRSLSDFFNH